MTSVLFNVLFSVNNDTSNMRKLFLKPRLKLNIIDGWYAIINMSLNTFPDFIGADYSKIIDADFSHFPSRNINHISSSLKEFYQ